MSQLKSEKITKNIVSNHKLAAIVGFLLALPLALLFLIKISEIEPSRSLFRNLSTEADGYRLNTFGMVLIIGSILLLPLGFAVNFVPIARNLRAGKTILGDPLNLFLAFVLFIFIARLVIGFVIDQYPCWEGVPNCD